MTVLFDFKFETEFLCDDIELDVAYSVSGSDRPATHDDPEESAEIELHSVLMHGYDILPEFSVVQCDELIDAAWEDLRERGDESEADAYERKMEDY